jgi:hypothetical protein
MIGPEPFEIEIIMNNVVRRVMTAALTLSWHYFGPSKRQVLAIDFTFSSREEKMAEGEIYSQRRYRTVR